MRTQTWSFSLQLMPTGQHFLTVCRSLYAPNGRQLPQQVLSMECPRWEEVTRGLNIYESAIGEAFFGVPGQDTLPAL